MASSLDIIKDPVTGNQYSRDLSVQGSTYQPYASPNPESNINKTRSSPDMIFDAARLQDVKPFVLPPQTPQTAGAGLSEFINSAVLAPYRESRTQQIQALEAEKQAGSGALQKIYDTLGMKGKRQEELYEAGGVDDKRRALDEVTNQIEAEQVALARRVESIERNSEGRLRPGMDAEIQRITRDSVRKQADLAIIQSAANRSYTTAAAIADRALEAEFEGYALKLDALKFFYAENKDELTKQQDREYTELINREERAYQAEYEQKKTLQDTKLQLLQSATSQGAPVSVLQAIQSATSPEAALQAAGQYSGDILDRQYKQAQIASANRANTGGGGSAQIFTKSQLNAGAARLKIPLDDFKNLDYETQNLAINQGKAIDQGYQAIQEAKAAGEDPSVLEGEISSDPTLPGAVKDSLVRYLYQVFPRQ